jgi:hypothetical protein
MMYVGYPATLTVAELVWVVQLPIQSQSLYEPAGTETLAVLVVL